MLFQTPSLDLDLFLLVNTQLRCTFFDVLMPALSSKYLMLGLLAIAAILTVLRKGKRQLILFLVLLVGMGLTDLSANFVKKQVQRVRPLNALAGVHYQEDGQWRQRPADFVQTKENGTSYPSSHAANTMCLALLAMTLWPGLKKWPLLLPLAVGYSRLYLAKHYPTDVLAGWAFGLITGTLVWLVWKHWAARRLGFE